MAYYWMLYISSKVIVLMRQIDVFSFEKMVDILPIK